MLFQKSLVSCTTEIWGSTEICEGERALSMVVCKTKRLTCKYASASLFIFVTVSKVRAAPNLHSHVHVFPH